MQIAFKKFARAKNESKTSPIAKKIFRALETQNPHL